MSNVSVSFQGAAISCYQVSEMSFDIQAKATRLYSGKMYVNLSDNEPSSFPRTFLCYCVGPCEIQTLINLIGTFGDLQVNGITYPGCYISALGGINEEILNSQKYTYSISFGKADQY